MSFEKLNSEYLKRLYEKEKQHLAFHQHSSANFSEWQANAKQFLKSKLGLERIAESVGNHKTVVELGESIDCKQYTRQLGWIETEQDVRMPFWLLKPKKKQNCPLGIFPHGHDPRGHDTTAGVYHDEEHRRKSINEDRDVAVQAVKHGFIAIAPATRGIAGFIVPDYNGRHGDRACRSHLMHCLLVSRTALGERVWDMQKLLNWALNLPEVDGENVLMMGNSGGGMVTLFTGAIDKRITISVPSCSFSSTVSNYGFIYHCDCNMVPGLMDIGGLPGVAGLIAPRYLLTVNGRSDHLHSQAEIEEAASQVSQIYQAAGYPQRHEHRWGNEGHRFYKDLMWPFILDIL